MGLFEATTSAPSPSEIVGMLELPSGTVNYHLKVLEAIGQLRIVRTMGPKGNLEMLYGR